MSASTWSKMSQTILKDTAVLTGFKAGGFWTLISTMHGEDVLVTPDGRQVEVDTMLPSANDPLTDVAIDMIHAWENDQHQL